MHQIIRLYRHSSNLSCKINYRFWIVHEEGQRAQSHELVALNLTPPVSVVLLPPPQLIRVP